MTTEQPEAAPHSAGSIIARRLRRRTSDRVLGGVAGGLGDYLNVDPVLLRAGFAGLMIFGGAGLVLYAVGWLLIPAQDHEDSIAEALLRQMARPAGFVAAALLVLIALILVSPGLTGYGGEFYIQPVVFWSLAVIVVGVLLLLGRDRQAGHGSSVATGQTPASTAAEAPVVGLAAQGRPASVPTPRKSSPLGWYAFAAVLMVTAALAAGEILTGVDLALERYFGAGLVAIGAALVVGAWWGRARILATLGVAVLPIALASAFITVPLVGGTGDHVYRPQSLGELQQAYRLVGGTIWLDLSHLQAGSPPVTIAASVGVGSLVVIVPENARVEIDAKVDGGQLSLLDGDHTGTSLVDRVERPGTAGGPSLILTLQAGLGSVRVQRAGEEGF
jgi:phage shock protein PspC (stress-responsive transcriptional regulator)